jgi:hypothetical protein
MYEIGKSNDLWRCTLEYESKFWAPGPQHQANLWLSKYPPGQEEAIVCWKRVCFGLCVYRWCWNPQCPNQRYRQKDATPCSPLKSSGHQHIPPEPAPPTEKERRKLRKTVSMFITDKTL